MRVGSSVLSSAPKGSQDHEGWCPGVSAQGRQRNREDPGGQAGNGERSGGNAGKAERPATESIVWATSFSLLKRP